MFSYIIDLVMAAVPFALMELKYYFDHQKTIEAYTIILLENLCKHHFYDICNNIMIPLYEVLFGQTPCRIIKDI